MLTYRNILDSFTRILSENYNDEIYTDELKQGFDKSCFFVSLIPISNNAFTKETNKKLFMISIKYFKDDAKKADLLDMLDSLGNIFIRGIRVKDRFITIKNSELDVENDGVSDYINYLITLDFVDDIKIEKEHFEPVGSIKINTDWEE